MEIKEKLLKRIRNLIKEEVNSLFIEEKYRDVRSSMFEAMMLNGVSFDVKNDKTAKTYYIENELELAEGERREFENKGGIIMFSTDVNAVNVSENRLKNWTIQKLLTFKNRYLKDKKIRDILRKQEKVSEVGFTIGNFVSGVYKAKDGAIYNEKSSSVEIIGVDSDILQEIAEDICREFNQESVLVKDYQQDKIYLVKP